MTVWSVERFDAGVTLAIVAARAARAARATRATRARTPRGPSRPVTSGVGTSTDWRARAGLSTVGGRAVSTPSAEASGKTTSSAEAKRPAGSRSTQRKNHASKPGPHDGSMPKPRARSLGDSSGALSTSFKSGVRPVPGLAALSQ
ncbi:MAG TPA: hypothetical protein VFS00_24540 [Polyangiaceae bacterium]|nr:hypothetical protein [Polyangiaceae bacterium]